MKRKKAIMAVSIAIPLMLGGCVNLGSTKGKKTETLEELRAKKYYVPVQEYTGKGYALPNGELTDKIAKAHRSEIEKAVKKFFKEKYKTEVIVHNVVGAYEGASVFVESVGEPHFYSFAIVPIDVHTKKVITDQVWSQEGQIEWAIEGGLYGMVYAEKIKKLNNYLNDFVSKNPVVGMRKEAIENVGGDGYSTPYYYVTVDDKPFDNLYELFIKNPNISKQKLANALNKSKIDPNNITITIDLFMKERGVKPDKKIFNTIVSDIEKMDGLPPGSYSISLHDNNINKITDIGTDNNILERAFPDFIVKQ